MHTYPQFVWALSSHRKGEVHPEIWHENERHTAFCVADGKFEVVPNVARHNMRPGDADLSLYMLARIFPPPPEYKWVRRDVRIVDPAESLA